jgi:superfamily II DNA or RNA helicase
MWPKGHPKEGEPMELRDYQPDIINRFFENPQSVQEVATGAGKTVITAALSDAVTPYGRSIVIVPNKSLVTQTHKDYKNMGLDVGVYFGDDKEYNRQHTICTWQSLNNLLKDSQNGVADITIQDFIEDVVCVIVDEVHMAKADVLKTLLTGVFARIPLRWGLTGTIPKEDYEFMSIKCAIGEVVGQLTASELQEAGHLANCHVNIVQLVDHVEYNNYQSELKYLLETEGRLDYIAAMVEEMRNSGAGNTLILVDRISAGKELESRIRDSVFVSGATKGTDRQDEYDDVATSSDKVIIATYGVAAVGINIPRIFNLVMVESGKSFTRVIQSIGRGIRKAADKDFVQIWDVTSTCKFAKRHLTKRKQFYRDANYPFSVAKAEWQ